MQIQKVQIISKLIGLGPCPMPEDEVEQHLTISASGRIWFTGYNYGDGYGKYIIGRRKQLSIGKEAAGKILSVIADCCEKNEILPFATDIGSWDLKITDTKGKKYTRTGSLCGVIFSVRNISDLIIDSIPIENIEAFG